MTQPLTHLGDMPIEVFIRDYWQKKPLLIRQAFPNFESPVSADELAGLALEGDIESRLILEEGKKPWELRCGPFTESDFSQLPKNKWTLLVQAVDHYVPQVADILDYFRFIPSWRLDDIMISYAVDGGSVGPHYDQYDVFLLQAEGQRRWQLGQPSSHASPKIEGIDLHILQQFEAQQEWILEPGDMLYIPPQLAHLGTAIGDECMTYSIGFRAPSHAELLNDFVQEQMSQLSEDQRFSDAGFTPQNNSGEISAQTIDKISTLLTSAAQDKEQLKTWFGQFITQPKYAEENESAQQADIQETLEELHQHLADGAISIERDPTSRFAFSSGAQTAQVFVSGLTFETSIAFATNLCGQRELIISNATEDELLCLAELIELGHIGLA